MSSTTPSDFIEDAFETASEMINKAPADSKLSTIVNFFITLIASLLHACTETLQQLHRRLLIVENTLNNIAPSTTAPAPSTASVNRPTTQHDTATSTQRQARCTQCHARGHTANLCRTSNPADMRKRVARNSRIAKQARASRSMSSIPTPAPSPRLYTAPHSPVDPFPMNFASLAADATELRRRTAQSARDKRIRRRAQTSTS